MREDRKGLVPGDLIEWVYTSNGDVIDKDEMFWSAPMKKWVPISVPALLISYTEDEYAWLSEKGLFRTQTGNVQGWLPEHRWCCWVVPRKYAR